MARYIDADALLENLKKQYGEELGWQCTVNMSDVGMMIEDAPTADIVPKSEVAREIFAEIESVFFHTLVVPTVTAIGIIENKKIDGLHIRIEDYNTIKKKYTEDQT